MSSPYTQPSIAGYNASPPPDDGSQVSSNMLTWAKHKTKLADPLKNYADAINAATLAAFSLLFGTAVLAKSSGYTVATTDRGRFITVTGTTTITLLSAITAGSGFPLLIVNNGTAIATLLPNGAETINGKASITLRPGDAVVLSSDGANWYGLIVGGKESGTFVTNWTGFTTAQASTWHYSRVGSIVNIRAAATLSATSNATGMVSGAEVPATIRPTAASVAQIYIVTNNGAVQPGTINLSSAGVISFGATVANTFFDLSGTKGFTRLMSFTYNLD